MYRGIQVQLIADCKSKKHACEVFDCSTYILNKWFYIVESKNDIVLKNSGKLFVEFFRSGEIPYFIEESKIGIPIPKDEAFHMINEHRSKFSTHRDAHSYYEKPN